MEDITSQRLEEVRRRYSKLTDAPIILAEYEKDEEARKRIAFLRQKVSELDWDIDYIGQDSNGNNVEVKDLAILFLHEYASGISRNYSRSKSAIFI